MYQLVAIGERTTEVTFLESSPSWIYLLGRAKFFAVMVRDKAEAAGPVYTTDTGAVVLDKRDGAALNMRFEIWEEVDD